MLSSDLPMRVEYAIRLATGGVVPCTNLKQAQRLAQPRDTIIERNVTEWREHSVYRDQAKKELRAAGDSKRARHREQLIVRRESRHTE